MKLRWWSFSDIWRPRLYRTIKILILALAAHATYLPAPSTPSHHNLLQRRSSSIAAAVYSIIFLSAYGLLYPWYIRGMVEWRMRLKSGTELVISWFEFGGIGNLNDWSTTKEGLEYSGWELNGRYYSFMRWAY